MTDNDSDITHALHRAADLLPDAPDRVAGVRRKRTARARRRTTAAVGVLALVAGGAAYGLTRTSGSAQTAVTAADSELTATGRVVQVPGKPPRACANVAIAGVGTSEPPAPAWCQLGVDVQGVDFATLDSRFEKDGAVEGYATLTGHLDGDVLVVTKQEPPRQAPPTSFHIAPCPAPPGGWRDYGHETNPDVTEAQAYVAQHPDLVAEIAISRPSKTQAVPFLLTWGDPDQVRTALEPSYGDQMCLQRSRWTKQEVAAAAAELAGLARTEGVYMYGSGHSLGDDGQLTVDAEAVRSTPALEAFAARHPAGLVAITYWLHPVTS